MWAYFCWLQKSWVCHLTLKTMPSCPGLIPTLHSTIGLIAGYFNKTLLYKSSERSSLISGPRLNSSLEAKNPGLFHGSGTTFHFQESFLLAVDWLPTRLIFSLEENTSSWSGLVTVFHQLKNTKVDSGTQHWFINFAGAYSAFSSEMDHWILEEVKLNSSWNKVSLI